MKSPLSYSVLLIIGFISFNVSAQNEQIIQNHDHDAPAFRPNMGQWEGDFSHVAHLARYSAYINDDGLSILLSPIEEIKAYHDNLNVPEQEYFISGYSYNIKYANSNTEAEVIDHEPSGPLRNYYLKSNPEDWRTGLKDSKQVEKRNFYQGVDVWYKIDKRQCLEFDFHVSPGVDPNIITWSYEGVEPYLEDNKIKYKTPYGFISEYIPMAYQLVDGKKQVVEISFRQLERGFGFELGDYNTDLELVIDPVIVASTLTGSTGSSNYGHGATYDDEGNVYSYGRGFGPGLPTQPGVVQPDFEGGGGVNVVINKFNPTGTDQIYATYLGGDESLPHSAVTNFLGELFIFGSTQSTDFPVVPGALQSTSGGSTDIFISRLSPDGTELIGSTYLGGSERDGLNLNEFGNGQYRGEVSLDNEGNLYLATCTESTDFPATGNAYSQTLNGDADGVVAKLDAGLTSAFWITLIGGSGIDSNFGVRVKDNGQVVVSGSSTGADFPTTANAYQTTGTINARNATVFTLNATGSNLIYSTYLSTSGIDDAYFLDLDNDEYVWVFGSTTAGDEWPVTDNVLTTTNQTLFVTKLDEALSQVEVSACIGGSFGSGVPTAFLVDRCDRVYISVYNAPGEMPLTDDALFTTGGFYLAAFEYDLSDVSYATYYTGNHVDGGTSRFDKKGIVYQGVCSGGGFNTNDDAFATDQIPGWDVGVFKIDFELSGVNAALSAPSELDGCAPHTVQFSNFSVGDIFVWDFGDGSPISDEFEPEHEFTSPGTYLVTLIASDSLSCNLADTVSVSIDIFAPEDFTPSFETSINCETGTVTMFNTTGGDSFLEFYWIINGDTLYTSYNATHTFVDLNADNTVALFAEDQGCLLSETVVQEINNLADVTASIGNTATTQCGLEISLENTSINAQSYIWDFGDGNTSSASNPAHTYSDYGNYTISLTAFNPSTCNQEDQVSFSVNFIEPPIIDPSFELSQVGGCSEFLIEGEMNNTANMASVVWFINGEEIAEGENFAAQMENQGLYEVTVQIEPTGCNNTFSVNQTIDLIADFPLDVEPQKDICYYETSTEIGDFSNIPNAEYLWEPGGETTPTIEATTEGTYKVWITIGSCSVQRTIQVGKGVKTFEGFETSICGATNTLLEVPVQFLSFEWENGEKDNRFYISEGGVYPFSYVDVGGCLQDGEVIVEEINPDPLVYIPNTFTPNEDGINDLFRPSVGDLDEYELKIYNRWGNLVFESKDPKQAWNGSDLKGSHFVNSGVYVYFIKYGSICSEDVIEKTGTLTLIR